MTAEFLMMNLQLVHPSTVLAFPAIALEHFLAEFLIFDRVQVGPRTLRANGAFTHFASARREKSVSARTAGM